MKISHAANNIDWDGELQTWVLDNVYSTNTFLVSLNILGVPVQIPVLYLESYYLKSTLAVLHVRIVVGSADFDIIREKRVRLPSLSFVQMFDEI